MSAPGAYAGTTTLARHVVRRDRARLLVWWLVVVAIPVSTYDRYAGLYPTAASRAQLSAAAGASPSFTLMLGPAYDLGSGGGFVAWRVGLWVAIFLTIFALLTVVRHTRAEEDAGRADLVASGAVGRQAPLLAATGVTLGVCVAAGAAGAVLLVAVGAAVEGSLLFGAAVALTGAVFAAVAAVTAQVASYSRAAGGLGFAVLGVAFLLRGYGDASGHTWVSWLSPLGWASQTRPYAGNRWLVLLLPLAATAVLLAVAGRLAAHRDVGAGLLVERPGRATAPRALRGAVGLAWRLQRGSLVGWAVGIGVTALVLGSLTGSVAGLVGDNEATRRILEAMGGSGQIAVLYLALLMPILGAVAVLYGVASVGRARTEETDGRLEPLLATPVSRLRWLGAQLLVAFGGALVLMLVAGLGVAATALPALDPGTVGLGEVVGGALLQVPAVWVLVAVGVALLGALPRATALAWVIAGGSLLITWLGPALGASDALLDVSPFEHLPKVPGHAVTAGAPVTLLAITLALVSVGTITFRRRDIPQ